MTEADWVNVGVLSFLVKGITDRASERKLRLFASACCRLVQQHLVNAQHVKALEVFDECAEEPFGSESDYLLHRSWIAARRELEVLQARVLRQPTEVIWQ